MTIQQFGALFKALNIYPAESVQKLLESYVIPQDIRISDPTWQSLISEVAARFAGARNHVFLLDFLKSVSHVYIADGRHNEFIFDLLKLRVPKLFVVQEGTDESVQQVDMEVAGNLSEFLNCYIYRHVHKHLILSQMATMMVSIYTCTCTRV